MKVKSVTSLLLAIAAVGCSDKKAANTSNFESALNHFVSHERKCILFEDSDVLTKSQRDSVGLNVLVDAGMMTRTPAAPDSNGQPMFQYGLTSKGKSTRENIVPPNMKSRTGYLCSGKLAVDKIVTFTEPAEDHGVHESRVTYRTKLVDIPDWAKTPSFLQQFNYFEPVATREGARETQTLILTNEGWKVDGDQ